MLVGYGCAEITPKRSMPLSGFAARCEKPFEAIDDPLFVRALAVEGSQSTTVALVYDLLGLGAELHGKILDALRPLSSRRPRRGEFVLCCTHTHSAPATITLLGCGEPQSDYWDEVIAASIEAARQALAALRPARLSHTLVELPGQNYNRRSLLDDGRVVMARHPDAPIRKGGPTWDRALLARFEDAPGHSIAGLILWAAHPDTVCGPNVTADFPGQLCRRLAQQCGFPFIYLQGACGNLNPILEEMTYKQMLANSEALMRALGPVHWPAAVDAAVSGPIRQVLPLRYGELPTREALGELRDGMRTIVETGIGPPQPMKMLSNILNVKPGEPVPDRMARHIACILQRWADGLLERKGGERPRSCELALAAWRIGPLCLCFIGAEVFVETALSLSRAFPDELVNVVSYAGPVVGYLPPDEALAEGGYEAAQAYVFYNHPAPFAKGSEPAVVQAFQVMVRELFTRDAISVSSTAKGAKGTKNNRKG